MTWTSDAVVIYFENPSNEFVQHGNQNAHGAELACHRATNKIRGAGRQVPRDFWLIVTIEEWKVAAGVAVQSCLFEAKSYNLVSKNQ